MSSPPHAGEPAMKRLTSRSPILSAATALAFFLAAPVYGQQRSGCFAHQPKYIEGIFEVEYAPGCTGHDEPELDPVSTTAGSAHDLTWTAVLPSGGTVPVSAVGP